MHMVSNYFDFSLNQTIKKIGTIVTMFMILSTLTYAQSPDWLWAKSAEGANYEKPCSVTTDSQGNIYLAGTFVSSTLSFGPFTLTNQSAAAFSDIFLVKYDKAGNVLWAKSAGGTNNDYPSCVAVNDQGLISLTGSFESSTLTFGPNVLLTGEGNCDAFLAQFDSIGNVLWARSAGGLYADNSNSVAIDASGNAYITGDYFSPSMVFGLSVLTNAGSHDMFIAKYDALGNLLWAKGLGGSYAEIATSVGIDADGNAIVTGIFYDSVNFGSILLSSAGGKDIFLAKFGAEGNVLWAKSIGGTTGQENASCIAINSNGDIFVTGYFSSASVVFGTTTLTNTATDFDVFLAKFNSSGDVLWAKSAGGISTDLANSVAADVSGNAYIIGSWRGYNLTFGNTYLTNANVSSEDVFIAKYDSFGNVVWAKSIGGVNSERANSITTDPFSNIITTGTFISPSLVIGSIVFSNLLGYDDIFLAKLNNTVDINELVSPLTIGIFPNPAHNFLSCKSCKDAVVEIFSIEGKLVHACVMRHDNAEIEIPDLADGVYFVKAVRGKEIYMTKFIKQ